MNVALSNRLQEKIMRQENSDPTKAGRNLAEGGASTGNAVANNTQANMATSNIAQSYMPKSIHEEQHHENSKIDIAQLLTNPELVSQGLEAGNVIASSYKNMTKTSKDQFYNNSNPLVQGLLSKQSTTTAQNNVQAYKSIGLKFASKDYEKEEILANEYSSHWEGDSEGPIGGKFKAIC